MFNLGHGLGQSLALPGELLLGLNIKLFSPLPLPISVSTPISYGGGGGGRITDYQVKIPWRKRKRPIILYPYSLPSPYQFSQDENIFTPEDTSTPIEEGFSGIIEPHEMINLNRINLAINSLTFIQNINWRHVALGMTIFKIVKKGVF